MSRNQILVQEGIMKKIRRKKKKKQKSIWLEGVSETGRNLVGKGQTGNFDIPATVHMKLISLKKPRLTFFFLSLFPLVSTSENLMKVPFVSQMSLCCDKLQNNCKVVRMYRT